MWNYSQRKVKERPWLTGGTYQLCLWLQEDPRTLLPSVFQALPPSASREDTWFLEAQYLEKKGPWWEERKHVGSVINTGVQTNIGWPILSPSPVIFSNTSRKYSQAWTYLHIQAELHSKSPRADRCANVRFRSDNQSYRWSRTWSPPQTREYRRIGRDGSEAVLDNASLKWTWGEKKGSGTDMNHLKLFAFFVLKKDIWDKWEDVWGRNRRRLMEMKQP